LTPYREDDSETYLTVPECAEVMHISEERARQLMRPAPSCRIRPAAAL